MNKYTEWFKIIYDGNKKYIRKKYRKYKRKYGKKISEYAEMSIEKAKQLYIKMTYINYIGRKLLIPLAFIKGKANENIDTIKDTSQYFVNLVLYIFMYGIPYCLAVWVVSNKFNWNIPFNLGWIFVTGLAWYTFKEETPRIIRSCFPPKSGLTIHD